MRFAEPLWWSTALLALPAGGLWWVTRKRRQTRALRFAGAQLLSELSTGPRRRRAPALLAALGAIALLGALAEPRIASVTGLERANVVLVIDVSGSMTATDVPPTRLTAAKAAATSFVENLPQNWRAGVVAFSAQQLVVSAPTDDVAALRANIGSLAAQGGTATGDALDLAIDVGRSGGAARLAQALEQRDNLTDPSRTVIVLLSDGKQTTGTLTTDSSALRADQLGIPIFTIAFGTDSGVIQAALPDGTLESIDVPPDLAASQRIAELSGGAFFTALDAQQLQSVYRSVRGVLERENVNRDVSAYPAMAAILLCAAAGLVALRGRVTP